MATEIKSARDALASISAWAEANLRDYGDDWRLHNRLCDMLKAALALPRRNCDVGTPDEQARRFEQFCGSVDGLCDKCELDPPGVCPTCGVRWSQWTYRATDEGREGDNNADE